MIIDWSPARLVDLPGRTVLTPGELAQLRGRLAGYRDEYGERCLDALDAGEDPARVLRLVTEVETYGMCGLCSRRGPHDHSGTARARHVRAGVLVAHVLAGGTARTFYENIRSPARYLRMPADRLALWSAWWTEPDDRLVAVSTELAEVLSTSSVASIVARRSRMSA